MQGVHEHSANARDLIHTNYTDYYHPHRTRVFTNKNDHAPLIAEIVLHIIQDYTIQTRLDARYTAPTTQSDSFQALLQKEDPRALPIYDQATITDKLVNSLFQLTLFKTPLGIDNCDKTVQEFASIAHSKLTTLDPSADGDTQEAVAQEILDALIEHHPNPENINYTTTAEYFEA